MPAPKDDGAVLVDTAPSGTVADRHVADGTVTDKTGRRPCDGALVRAFSFLGKRWNGVILANLFEGPAGFSELRRAVGSISDSVLSERLVELAAADLIERSVSAGPPVAVTYTLTDAGRALLPAMHALANWADAHLPE